jgi:hypothetical protein
MVLLFVVVCATLTVLYHRHAARPIEKLPGNPSAKVIEHQEVSCDGWRG